MKIDAALRLPSGRSYACTTSDYSDGGVGLTLSEPVNLLSGEVVRLALSRGMEKCEFEASVTMNRGTKVGLQFSPMTTQQAIDFVQCTFARADSWVVWGDKRKPDKPWESFKEVSWMGVRGFKVLVELLVGAWRERKARLQTRVNMQSVKAVLAQRQSKPGILTARSGGTQKSAP
jgi:cellulose synthase (UDP-forming)